jgi:putative spermidine/putrescine transport system ATP-binding protein
MSSETVLKLRGVTRTYGSVRALDALDLDVRKGELVALLGPSGCGKTTALRIVAGLERADQGELLMNGRDISSLPAHRRNMGMVFQAYSLFPNLTVLENVGFGLRMRKVAAKTRAKRALELLELVGLPTQARRYPHQLSGGQQQRVALARALAIEPEVLLLDEPLSALDAQVRSNLRDEIRRTQLALGTTALFVTHDQEEAMAIADRVGVMHSGNLEQIAEPDVLYAQPATPFVASFVGINNNIATKVESDGTVRVLGRTLSIAEGSEPLTPGAAANALVRPEAVGLANRNGASQDGSPGTVVSRSFLGPVTRIQVALADGQSLLVNLPSNLAREFTAGVEVVATAMTNEVVVQRPKQSAVGNV